MIKEVSVFIKRLEKHAGFSDLPGEVRIKIYAFVLKASSPIHLDAYYGGACLELGHDTGDREHDFCPQLLQVCRQIYFETQRLLISKNKFHFQTHDMILLPIPHDISAMFPHMEHLVIGVNRWPTSRQYDILKFLLEQTTRLNSCSLEILHAERSYQENEVNVVA